ncbi:hypothetical protein ES705_46945 [subsurface metagenome]
MSETKKIIDELLKPLEGEPIPYNLHENIRTAVIMAYNKGRTDGQVEGRASVEKGDLCE